MSILEVSVAVIALSAVAFALAVWIVLAHVLPVLKRMEILAADAATTLHRLNGIAADLEGVAHDARRLEMRVSNTAGVLLDQLEPPVRVVSALLAGLERDRLAPRFVGKRAEAGRTKRRTQDRKDG